MQSIDFILREEPFKMLLMEKAPKAEPDTAILLYRKGAGPKKGLVIEPNKMVLSNTIRMGKYDTKAIVDLSQKRASFEDKIRSQEGYCDFLIHIDIALWANDIPDIVENKRSQCAIELCSLLRKCIDDQQENFSILELIELRRTITGLFSEAEKQFPYLLLQIQSNIEPDENGKRIIESEKRTSAEGVILENEQEYIILKTRAEEEEKRFKNKEDLLTRKEKEEGEQELSDKKIIHLAELMQEYGPDALLLKEYGDSKLSAGQLHEIHRMQEKEDNQFRTEQYWRSVAERTINDDQKDEFADKFIFSKTVQEVIPEEKRSGIEKKHDYDDAYKEIMEADADEY